MQQHKLVVPRTAHYCTLGQPGPHIRYFWIVTHGYGQLAKKFIRKFEAIEAEDTLVVAPEGLSKFYWGGLTGGEPVASWMTKENRLDEIADYAGFIHSLYNQFLWQLPQDVKIILFGFSQGCATQMRWVMRHLPAFDHMVAWAGHFPEDLDYTQHSEYFKSKKLNFIYGDEDEFLTPPRLEFVREIFKKNNLTVGEQSFKGKHRVDRQVLKAFVEEHIR